ncbi:hypothetical protein [Sphingomonas nostoxanthinifaciens]|uniref:hypothetical protein n=1 Tax=Sphingomonas nostoxanthinifaciens TaxID=2872652 RepID=UPI001CC203AE|nr:hypothetical protein [Sphingomonas nostoxanthinifaciens]
MLAAEHGGAAPPIDRHALVTRHDIHATAIDPHAPVMLGNGTLGFTADITGLQTFPDHYAPTAPLLTMAQWAWHSFPRPPGLGHGDGSVMVPVPGRGPQPFAYIRDLGTAAHDPAVAWLRENPHHISLARVALALRHADGRPVRFEDLSTTDQTLDLWTGTLTSRFRLDGQPVTVVTRIGAPRDLILVEIRSPLVARGQIGIDLAFPGVSRTLNPDPADWTHPEAHRTQVVARAAGRLATVERIDATAYATAVAAPGASIAQTDTHRFTIHAPGQAVLRAVIALEDRPRAAPLPAYAAATEAAMAHWRDYWTHGGMIDLSGTADPRARELERRIVLSQYLAAINAAGATPPQEEGLFSNSWNGKFHLEMHPWHAAHFATWGRPVLLERSLAWYLAHLPAALAEGRRHGLDAAWWPKMTGPDGRNSPSPINPFIFWQQPHPIYLAELIWRGHPDRATLARYAPMVAATARLLAGWPRLDPATGLYHLGPPIVPVQENHDPFTTADPAFELEYFRWGLQVAQQWRERQGLARDAGWDRVITGMTPMPRDGDRYMAVAGEGGYWARIAASCRGKADAPGCPNRDHPSFLMSDGPIGSDRVDRATMARTLAATTANWDWAQVWGWDFPSIAMTAARLGDPDAAVGWLLRDAPNNQWGSTGMTPRFDTAAAPDGAGTYPRSADTYFPSNGALLLATGMMAAGWTGATGPAPGFPADWHVRVEGITPLP